VSLPGYIRSGLRQHFAHFFLSHWPGVDEAAERFRINNLARSQLLSTVLPDQKQGKADLGKFELLRDFRILGGASQDDLGNVALLIYRLVRAKQVLLLPRHSLF
jgi:hypothetical protein